MLWYEYPNLSNRKVLSGMVGSGMTTGEIAEAVGCSKSAVRTALKNHGIRQYPRVRMPEELRRRLGL